MKNGIEVTRKIRSEFKPAYGAPDYEVADIFRLYGGGYREIHKISPIQRQVMQAIENCRTADLGGHVDECEACGHLEISYNSCRNRHCPKCQGSNKQQWIEDRASELLPIQYFHIVFTLPEELVPLARYNAEIVYALLFKAAADTLQAFAERQWDAQLGIILVLHTWGQTLNEHPHVHCIVTGGALKLDGSRFIRCPKNYLFPVNALVKVFRGKYVDYLRKTYEAGELPLRGLAELEGAERFDNYLQTLKGKRWIVYAKKPFDEPLHIVRYVAQYTHRVAISNHRILSIDNGEIRFKYRDYREGQEKDMSLSAQEFIRRFLCHVIPKGFKRIRRYGILANGQCRAQLAHCRGLLGRGDDEQSAIADDDDYLTRLGHDPSLCPVCGQGTLKRIEKIPAFYEQQHDPPDSYRTVA